MVKPRSVMDFPGTIHQDHHHFVSRVFEVTGSLAYHGFKKLILLNDHGSNAALLDLVSRRTLLETDAACHPLFW